MRGTDMRGRCEAALNAPATRCMQRASTRHGKSMPPAERCRSGRTGRSRKPLCALRTQGSNPCLSAKPNLRSAGAGVAASSDCAANAESGRWLGCISLTPNSLRSLAPRGRPGRRTVVRLAPGANALPDWPPHTWCLRSVSCQPAPLRPCVARHADGIGQPRRSPSRRSRKPGARPAGRRGGGDAEHVLHAVWIEQPARTRWKTDLVHTWSRLRPISQLRVSLSYRSKRLSVPRERTGFGPDPASALRQRYRSPD